MNIGSRLQELRAARGLSQGDVEKRTGLLRCNISRFENRQIFPNLKTLEKLGGAFDIEFYQLFFTGKGKPQPAGPRDAGKLGTEERGLFEAFKKLGKRDKKIVLAIASKMAKGNRSARRAT